MQPVVHRLAEEFAGQVAVWQLDAADGQNAPLLEQYGVHGHPVVVTLDADGRVVRRLPGYQDEERLRTVVREVLP